MMDAQSYKDHCLIVIGCGSEAEEFLVRRRLAAGGRLIHVLTHGPDDDRVEISQMPSLEGCFLWHPPRGPLTKFGMRFGPSGSRYWTRTGPNAVELLDHQKMNIFFTSDCNEMQHVRILDEEGSVDADMSGAVVLNPDLQLAAELDVEVANPDLRPAGTFSWRFMLLSSLLLLPWSALKWVIAAHCESHAEAGQLPWWRGLLITAYLAVPALWGFVQSFTISMAGEMPT